MKSRWEEGPQLKAPCSNCQQYTLQDWDQSYQCASVIGWKTLNCLPKNVFNHQVNIKIKWNIHTQDAFNCGPSSHPDFIKNYFLLKRMFRFFRHSRQMPYFNVSRLKVTHFNVLAIISVSFNIFGWRCLHSIPINT